jgi:hypothetical protein
MAKEWFWVWLACIILPTEKRFSFFLNIMKKKMQALLFGIFIQIWVAIETLNFPHGILQLCPCFMLPTISHQP